MGSFSGPGLSLRPKRQKVPNESENLELNPRKFVSDFHPTVSGLLVGLARGARFNLVSQHEWMHTPDSYATPSSFNHLSQFHQTRLIGELGSDQGRSSAHQGHSDGHVPLSRANFAGQRDRRERDRWACSAGIWCVRNPDSFVFYVHFHTTTA